MGSKPYHIIDELGIDYGGAIVEIGSQRNEGSTTYLSWYATKHNNQFYTVDIDRDQYLSALHITQGRGAYCMSGEEFLGNIFPLIGGKIAFAYLDNFDLVTHDGRDWTQRKALYKSYGLDMTNTNSKIAHMTQALLVEKHAADHCYILFDDTWIDKNTGKYDGKGAWAISPLEKCGFKVINSVFSGDEAEGLKYGKVLLER